MKQIATLIACIAVPLGLGAWAGIVTSQNISSWYETLQQPSFNPPNWLFAPVWTMLYILMGISFYLIIRQEKNSDRQKAIFWAIGQMVLNTLWSFLFFYFHQIFAALVDILLLWIFIIMMIRSYYPIHRLAAWIQLPYLAWVTFASILNASYFFLNL